MIGESIDVDVDSDKRYQEMNLQDITHKCHYTYSHNGRGG